jgi:DNA-binding MarR family transcriptional regulator
MAKTKIAYYPLHHDEYLSTRNKLKPNELDIYLYLITKHPFADSKLEIDTSVISEELGYHRRTVQLAIKKLVSLDLIQMPDNRQDFKAIERKVTESLKAALGGKTEVKTPVGRIDLLTDTEIIEVKNIGEWKGALGQLLIYSLHYPNHKKRIHLFGKNIDGLAMISDIIRTFDITVTGEEISE